MDRDLARRELVRGLQLAYSGELGAIRAYLGHRIALRDPTERNGISRILKDEIRHRRLVLRMLEEVGSAPDPWAERKLDFIGRCIAFACFVTGWFVPVYGAARLENANIVEYEILARLAWHAGLPHWIDDLLHLAEVEWDHEQTLRSWASRHWLWRVFPSWTPPAPRESIRGRYQEWTANPTAVSRPRAYVTR